MARSILSFSRKLFILPALYFFLSSHEFWIEPDKFFYSRGETINLRFRVGMNFEGDNWSGNRSRVKSMHFYFGGVRDSCNHHLSTVEGDSMQIALHDEGTAMVTMNTHNSYIELDAASFNDYLREEGLTDILKYRSDNGDSSRMGREFYQRSIKSIIQVGNHRDRTYKLQTSLPIDIVPDDHPYHLAKDDNFKVKVYFMNKPLTHHLVKIWHRQNDRTTVQEHMTDENGEVKFFMTPSGRWMVSTVKMVKLDNDPEAEWQSYWGSLTMGYD